MGQLKGPLSGSTGSAWDLTLTTWKGEKIFKGKRKKGMLNPSDSVIAHQSSLRQTVAFGQKIFGDIQTGFAQYRSTIGQWAAYLKANLKFAFDYSSLPAATFVPADFAVSKGLMTPTAFAAPPVADNSAATISVTWPTAIADDTQLASDVVRLIAYNVTQEKLTALSGSAARSAGALAPSTPVGFMTTGDTVVVYMYFYGAPLQPNENTESNSINTSVTVVA